MIREKMLLLLIAITPSILIGMEKKENEKPAAITAPLKEEEPKRKLSASKIPVSTLKEIDLKKLTAGILQLPVHETPLSGYLD